MIQVTGTQSNLRKTHRGLMLRDLLVNGETSRKALADNLGLSQMAASRIARELLDAGLVEEAGQAAREAGPGRHQTLLRLLDSGAYAAGINMSAFATEVAIVGATGSLVAQREIRVDLGGDGQKILMQLVDALFDLIEEHDIPRERLCGVGVIVSAQFDHDRRRAVSASALGLQPFDVVNPIAERTDLPVVAENIANALALAEKNVGIAKNVRNIALLRPSVVVGSSMIVEGNVVRGNNNSAGRFGHMYHSETTLTCSCGRNDCLNCAASGWSVLVQGGIEKNSTYDPLRIQDYAEEIRQLGIALQNRDSAEPEWQELLRRAGAALGEKLRIVDQTIEPEAILLAGPMIRMPGYLDGIHERLQEFGDDGVAICNKIRMGGIRAVRAAAILALLDMIYSPALNLSDLSSPSLMESSA